MTRRTAYTPRRSNRGRCSIALGWREPSACTTLLETLPMLKATKRAKGRTSFLFRKSTVKSRYRTIYTAFCTFTKLGMGRKTETRAYSSTRSAVSVRIALSIPSILYGGRMFTMVWTALITPYREDGGINYDEYARLLEDQHRSGVDGVLVLGTTGEAPSLSDEEKMSLYEFAAKNAPKGLKLMAGTGTNNLKKTVFWTEKVMEMGYDYALVVVPYYLKTSQRGLYGYFKKVAEETDARIILYNVPGRTGTNMRPETVIELSRIENIKGIKEASGSADAVSEIVRSTSGDFLVLSGDDSMTLPFLSIGAHGVISVASNVFPEIVVRMVKERRKDLHLLLYPLFKVLFVEPNPIPVRYAMELMGYNVGPYRLPLTEPSQESKRRIEEVVREIRANYPTL